MKIQVCVGSTCHLYGSQHIVNRLQKLIKDNHLDADVEFGGKFCMGQCGDGVTVKVDDTIYKVGTDTVDDFFNENILKKLK